MMRYLLIAAVAMLSFAVDSSAADPRYLHLMVEGDGSPEICHGSLWFDVTQEKQYGGVYYIASKACGITSEASRYQSDDLKFELVFNLVFNSAGEQSWIGGATRALSYTDKDHPGRAERTSTEKAIEIGKKLLLASHSLADDRTVNLYAEIADELPADCADCGQSAVVLSSTFSRNGTKFSSNRSGRKFLAEGMEFQSSIDAGIAGPGSPRMQYSVLVHMPGAMRALKERTTCQITLQRLYHIQSSGKGANDKDFSVSYNSKNTKEVILEPGKELRLVFPPDSPAVEGFDIEDTLIIVPK